MHPYSCHQSKAAGVALDVGSSELRSQFELMKTLLFHPQHQGLFVLQALLHGALGTPRPTTAGSNQLPHSMERPDDQLPSLSMASTLVTSLTSRLSQQATTAITSSPPAPQDPVELRWKAQVALLADRLVLKLEKGSCLALEELHFLQTRVVPQTLPIASSHALVSICSDSELTMVEITELGDNLGLLSMVVYRSDLSRTTTCFLLDLHTLLAGYLDWSYVLEVIRSESLSLRNQRPTSSGISVLVHPTWKVWASRLASWSGEWILRFERMLKTRDPSPTIYLAEKVVQRRNVTYCSVDERGIFKDARNTKPAANSENLEQPSKMRKLDSKESIRGLTRASLPSIEIDAPLNPILGASTGISPNDALTKPSVHSFPFPNPAIPWSSKLADLIPNPPLSAMEGTPPHGTQLWSAPVLSKPQLPSALRAESEETHGSSKDSGPGASQSVSSSVDGSDEIKPSKQTDFSCSECGKKFYKNSTLTRHIESVHQKKRPFQCPGCDREFGRMSNMERHIQVCHKGIKQCVCETCGWKFAQTSDLKKHVRRKHPHVTVESVLVSDRNQNPLGRPDNAAEDASASSSGPSPREKYVGGSSQGTASKSRDPKAD